MDKTKHVGKYRVQILNWYFAKREILSKSRSLARVASFLPQTFIEDPRHVGTGYTLVNKRDKVSALVELKVETGMNK